MPQETTICDETWARIIAEVRKKRMHLVIDGAGVRMVGGSCMAPAHMREWLAQRAAEKMIVVKAQWARKTLAHAD